MSAFGFGAVTILATPAHSVAVGLGNTSPVIVPIGIGSTFAFGVAETPPVITLDGQGPITRTTSAGNFNVTYPTIGPEDAGKLLILRYGHVNNATLAGNTFTTPVEFTDRFAADQQSNLRNWIASRVCDGTESGAVTITVTGGSGGGRYGRIDMWAGVDTTTDDGIYAPSISKASSTTIDDADVATTADNDAAVNVVLHSLSGPTIGDFVGESGGAWLGGADDTPAISPSTGLFYDLDVDTATIGGGSFTVGSGAWIARGFALKAAGAPALPLTINATGFAATLAAGAVPIAVPHGHGAAVAFGSPAISITIEATGFSGAFSFGSVPYFIQNDVAFSFSFGSTIVDNQSAAISTDARQHAGRGLGELIRLETDALLDRWLALEKRRKKKEQERRQVESDMRHVEAHPDEYRDPDDSVRRLETLEHGIDVAIAGILDHERAIAEAIKEQGEEIYEMSAANRQTLRYLDDALDAAIRDDDEEVLALLLGM